MSFLDRKTIRLGYNTSPDLQICHFTRPMRCHHLSCLGKAVNVDALARVQTPVALISWRNRSLRTNLMKKLTILAGFLVFGILGFSAFYFDMFSPSYKDRLRADPRIIGGLVEPAVKQGATPEYIDVLLTLRSNGVPTKAALAAIGPMIDQRFGAVPGATGEYNRSFTLLDHALNWRNEEAVIALLEAGADPHTSAEHFVDAASVGENGRPDWESALRFTELFLEYGGRVDYANATDTQPMFVKAVYRGNYEASVPFGRPAGKEFLIWFQAAGYLDDAPREMVQLLYDDYLDSIDLIVTDQTMLSVESITLIRDLLDQGRHIAPDYRTEDRADAVAALTRYVLK